VNDGLSPPGVTGFLQYGMKPSVTVGLLGDIFADGGQAGAEVTAAVPVGEVSGTTHLSWDKDAGVGWSVRGGYRLNILDRTTLPVIAVSTGYRSRSFVIPAAAGASSPSWEVTGSISQLLPAQVGATLSYAYRDYHDDIDPTSVVYASLSRRLSRGASARITGYLDTMAPEEEWADRSGCGVERLGIEPRCRQIPHAALLTVESFPPRAATCRPCGPCTRTSLRCVS